MTWWGSGGTSPGASLQEAARTQHGDRVTLSPKSPTKDQMMASLEQILDGTDRSETVDAFLTHPGRDLLRWTRCGPDQREDLRQLNAADAYPNLTARFERPVLQGLQCCPPGGDCEVPDVYAVPLALHQMNHIVSNKKRFAVCAGTTVTDVPSLLQLLDCLHADGRRVISVPVSDFQRCELADDDDCWRAQDVAGQSLQYLLDILFLLEAGPSAYQAHWRAPCRAEDGARAEALLLRVLQDLDLLRPYLNGCAADDCSFPPDFKTAVGEVSSGKAAFVVAPDWTQLNEPGASEKAELGAFPGTRGTFLFTTDSFAVPALSNSSGEAGLRWVDTLLKPEVQDRFATVNGAHAALGDHSQLAPLVPSLEIQLPPSADPMQLRVLLNNWARDGFSTPPPLLEELMNHDFGQARELGLLPAGPGDSESCELP